jgi:glycosyltransferase involved in cell wall biosynthesis
MPPTLSICIPTYNRAELLESALGSIAPQVAALKGRVELIISDNCSTDATREVVERAARQWPVRYHRNEENVGAIRNILNLIERHARGEFCWLLGDDELLREGAVGGVLSALEASPGLDYFYVNYSMDSFDRRRGLAVTADDFLEWTRTGDEHLEARWVEPWETLLGDDFGSLTPIYCSVFRRAVWLEGAATLRLNPSYSDAVLYSSVEETFPHSVIFARTMKGKRVRASGHPWVIMCSTESWSDFIPVVVLLRFHELLDEYIARGVDARLLERHRRRMLGYAGDLLTRIAQGERLPGLESFSIVGFIARHYRYRELWRAVYGASLVARLGGVARHSPAFAAFALCAKLFFHGARGWSRLRTRLGLSTSGTAS